MTTTNKATALQTQVLCANTLNEHAKQIISKETAHFTKLIGQNILKADGSFKAKFETEKMIFKYQTTAYGLAFWVDTSYYFTSKYGKLSIQVATTVWGGGADKNGVNLNHNQQTANIDLFDIVDGKISPLTTAPDLSHLDIVYDDAEILKAAKEVEEAARVYELALKTVPYQFRGTLYLQRLTN